MDVFYGNFRSNSEFFTNEDFIFHVGAAVADLYRQEYLQKYGELRQEKSDSMVELDPTWLNEQELEVEIKDGRFFAPIKQPFMNFPYDAQSTGIQSVFSVTPNYGKELQRVSLNQLWQLQYIPATNEIFFAPEKKKLNIFKYGTANTQKVKMFYVPAIGDDMEIPDGLVELAMSNTVSKMKGLLQGNVVKKSIDGSQNKTMETEINPNAIPRR
jgi:hypothetical protein